MANTIFQLKRSTVSGVTPTTVDIVTGELGINVTDKKLFSSNGSAVFELGSNLSSLFVTSTANVSGNVAIGGALSSANLTTTTNVATLGTAAYVVANGNVGIGTTAPNARLAVTGTANVSGNVIIGGNITSAGTVTDSKGDVRTLVVNPQGAGYTLVAADHGKLVDITTGGVTVPINVFTAGQNITIYNDSAASQTITQGSTTLRLAGTAITGNRTLAQRGICTIICVASNEFVISGAGLT